MGQALKAESETAQVGGYQAGQFRLQSEKQVVCRLCPPAYKPYTLRDTLEDFPLPEGAVGTVRMFKVPFSAYHSLLKSDHD